MEGNFRRGAEPNRADRLDGPVLDGSSSNKRKMQYNSKRRPVLVVHLDSALDFLGIGNLRRNAGSGVDFIFETTESVPIQRGVGYLSRLRRTFIRRRGRSRARQRAEERKKELDEEPETVSCTS